MNWYKFFSGALLWKIEFAVRLGLTGTACTDKSAEWNRGTKKNVVPGEIQGIDFKLRRQIQNGKPAPRLHDPQFQKFRDHNSLVKSFDTVPLKGLASVPGTILSLTLNAPPAETTDEILAPRSVPSHGFHSGT